MHRVMRPPDPNGDRPMAKVKVRLSITPHQLTDVDVIA
jgi:hypothetical protein